LAFSATLPKSDPYSRRENEKRDKLEAGPLQGMHILVVDDSQDIQFLVKRLLTKNGVIVESAANGLEGVAKATSDSYDVILMDIQMPMMDGYQAKKVLDEMGYRKPIIALTAHAMSEERQKTAQAGFVTHLTKPLIANELFKAVSDIGRALH
jgi:CheY-like chemotaxis protein